MVRVLALETCNISDMPKLNTMLGERTKELKTNTKQLSKNDGNF